MDNYLAISREFWIVYKKKYSFSFKFYIFSLNENYQS